MNLRKTLPVILLIVLAVVAIAIKRCNTKPDPVNRKTGYGKTIAPEMRFTRNAKKLFFTQHARCRMKCRNITQQEIKEILADGKINYNKSNLQDPRGATYALEGTTRDRQHVRVIFAPRQAHMSIITVIDLDSEHQCDCE